MENTVLATPFVAVVGGVFFVALVASVVPVEGRRLPAILRAARFPFRNERDPGFVGIATSVATTELAILVYRFVLAGFVALLVAALGRVITDQRLATNLGTQPLFVGGASLLGLAAWSAFVVFAFLRARPHQPGRTAQGAREGASRSGQASRTVPLTRAQAFQVVRAYLAEFLDQLPHATLREVLADTNPGVWEDRQPLDPAVPGDWMKAAAAVAAVAARSTPDLGDGHEEPTLPADKWLPALFPFLESFWSILGPAALSRVLELLAQPQVAVQGSDLSPWQRWMAATSGLVPLQEGDDRLPESVRVP
jgi:hypothetical protein